MPKDNEGEYKELRSTGHSDKQARAIIKARAKKKKGTDAASKIKAATSAKNAALNDIYNW